MSGQTCPSCPFCALHLHSAHARYTLVPKLSISLRYKENNPFKHSIYLMFCADRHRVAEHGALQGGSGSHLCTILRKKQGRVQALGGHLGTIQSSF